jgi:hypothetical protein
MVRVAVVLVALLGIARATPAAEQDLELKAAQQELRLAQAALEAAGRRYGEHRADALAHVKQAIREIRLGLLDAAVEREHGPTYQHRETR